MSRAASFMALSLALALVAACGRQPAAPASAEEHESWAVTAWGECYEVFAETEGLVAGRSALSNAHVTVHSDFSPLRAGTVTLVLRSAGGREQVFRSDKPKRDGIFPVEARPGSEGEYELLFRIESAAGQEEIAAGRVRVGSAGKPGGALDEGSPAGPDSVTFLKEQQWRTAFATAWATEGTLHEVLSGPSKVRPAAGGEAVLTATADATVAAEPWPHVGLAVEPGSPVFRLHPRVGDRSLPEVQADAAALAAEADSARRRVERLEGLLAVEATSAAELERARATLVALEARLAAARQGLRATDGRGAGTGTLEVTAPWAGRVAEVAASPGQAVTAGTALGRVVRTRPLWLEVALRPEDAARLQVDRLDLDLRRAGQAEPLHLRGARVVARAPEVDPRTAALAVTVELDVSTTLLPIGTTAEADLLLPGQRRGIVVPLSSLVQDAGAAVVYVQLGGEAFARREVRVLERQAGVALVEGLRAHERVVTVGGAAVRRASLLSSGAPEGHVH